MLNCWCITWPVGFKRLNNKGISLCAVMLNNGSWRLKWSCCKLYRVIKKSPCTWWLQYRKLQVVFKVPPRHLQTFTDAPICVLEDCVQYSTVHITNVFCDNRLHIINCVKTVIVRCTETFWLPPVWKYTALLCYVHYVMCIMSCFTTTPHKLRPYLNHIDCINSYVAKRVSCRKINWELARDQSSEINPWPLLTDWTARVWAITHLVEQGRIYRRIIYSWLGDI